MQIIPGLFEILGGKVEVSRIRGVEIEDLLGRRRSSSTKTRWPRSSPAAR
jgi:FlaA1/EpsC-like NDP-sugar epimerase